MIVQPSFREAVQTFFRRKFTFLLVFGGVCLAGAAYLLLATPLYLSNTSLVVRFDQHAAPNIDRTQQSHHSQLGSNERREILHSDADDFAQSRPGTPYHRPGRAGAAVSEDRQQRSKMPPHKMDDAVRAFSSDLVVDVGLQSDVINVSFLNPNAGDRAPGRRSAAEPVLRPGSGDLRQPGIASSPKQEAQQRQRQAERGAERAVAVPRQAQDLRSH